MVLLYNIFPSMSPTPLVRLGAAWFARGFMNMFVCDPVSYLLVHFFLEPYWRDALAGIDHLHAILVVAFVKRVEDSSDAINAQVAVPVGVGHLVGGDVSCNRVPLSTKQGQHRDSQAPIKD